jgi:hypothetical protein
MVEYTKNNILKWAQHIYKWIIIRQLKVYLTQVIQKNRNWKAQTGMGGMMQTRISDFQERGTSRA